MRCLEDWFVANTIKHINTISALTLELLVYFATMIRNRSVSSSFQYIRFVRSTNCFVGRLQIVHQSTDRAWTFRGHGTDNTRFAVQQFTEMFNRISHNLLDMRKLLVMSQSPNAISMCIT